MILGLSLKRNSEVFRNKIFFYLEFLLEEMIFGFII